MHKKAKITYPRMKGIPAVLTTQGFHKGRLDCIEVSVIHCLDGIAINASSREVFHRRRLALPSPTLNSTSLSSFNPSSSNLPSSLNSPVKGEQDEKVDKNKTDKKIEKSKTVEILLRDAFGTFKGEVPYYSARVLSIPEMSVPPLQELENAYERMCEERSKEDENK